MTSGDAALLDLLRLLAERRYRFVTPTPATHARVVVRAGRGEARDLRDVLGWSQPFRVGAIDAQVAELLWAANAVEPEGDLLRATIRVSSLHERLFVHSAYPTDAADAVFFGPDSYRFADLIRAELAARPLGAGARIVDIGTGSGVGAIVAATRCTSPRVGMVDVNPAALRFAHINAQAAGIGAKTLLGNDLSSVSGARDLAVANPPYLIDEGERTYRHGGGARGGAVSLEMARMAVERLAPGGSLILFTGSAIVDGADALRADLERLAVTSGCTLAYNEIDPDVFGEELERPAYAGVERIALVSAVISRPA